MGKLEPNELGQIIKETRYRYSLSQKELAENIGISRSMLSKAESGKRKLSEKNLEILLNYFSELEENDFLRTKIDYLSIHFPTINSEQIITKVLGITSKHFELIDSAPLGYDDRLTLLNIINLLRSHDSVEKGILLELSGQGCTMLAGWLKSRGESWFDFIGNVFKHRGNFTRIDLSLDDSVGIIDLDELKRKIDHREFWSKFRIVDVISSKNISKNESNGTTIYFGSRKSQVHFCFYQKNYEQKRKRGIELEDSLVANRYELRFRHEKAEKLAKELLKNQDLEDIIYKLLNTYLCFYDRPKDDPTAQIDSNWKRLVGYTTKLQLSVDSEPVSYSKSVSWIINSVAPTLKFLSIVDKGLNARLLEQIIQNAELNHKHKALIEIIKENAELYRSQIQHFENTLELKQKQKESKAHATEIHSVNVHSALDKLSIPYSEKLLNNKLGGFQNDN